jgi:oxygen-dependent protoporphyrinogen oxidase
MPEPLPHVAVVGGGITGLATAWFLRGRATVTLVEADARLGGKIRTDELGGVPVEAGPDTFLARVPWATDLCRSLGLGEELVPPATASASVKVGDRLRPLPSRHVLGVPTALRPLLDSGVLSPAGVARAALDLTLPCTAFGPDPSVADVIGPRLGREVLERMVEPLIGGINAGRAHRLSLAATARPLADAARSNRSLILGLRHAPPPAPGPVFLGVAGGLERLVDSLRLSLANTAQVRVATRATDLRQTEGGAWRVACQPGPGVDADAVVVTTPATVAAAVLRSVAPEAAAELAAIRYASVALATLAYRPSAVPHPLEGSGYLVPRTEGLLHTACTFSSSKWPALTGSGLVTVRASAGRDGDDRPAGLDDAELVARLHREVSAVIGAAEPPVSSLVSRWPRSFPQYDVGHQARVEALDAALPAGVVVAGAAYRGLGIASCVQQAAAAADAVTAGARRRVP